MRSETVGCCTLYLADYRDVLPALQGITAVVAEPPNALQDNGFK